MDQQAATQMIMASARTDPRLQQLMAEDPSNQECADCTAKDPTWASWNIGVFLCERCCGVHRSIGTHISKPRSIEIDDWSEQHLEAMQVVGNTNGDAYWCYNVPLGREKPEANDPMALLQDWIRAKYERKEFLKRGAEQERPNPGVQAYERAGLMEKESGGSGTGKWQARWFVLKDFSLSYYKEQPQPGKKNVAKGIIAITPQTTITAQRVDTGAQDRPAEATVFVLRSNLADNDRVFYFRAGSPADMHDWMIKLRGVRAYAGSQQAREATDTAFSGWMLKQGGKGIKKWQRRWVVLRASGDVLYYEGNKTSHPSGTFKLQGPSVSLTTERPFCLEFSDHTRQKKAPVIMAAETEHTYQDWLLALGPWLRRN